MKLSILTVPAPGGGAPSSARDPLGGVVSPDFASLLSGMAKGAASETPLAVGPGNPPVVEETGSDGSLASGALVKGDGGDREAGSQQRASLPGDDGSPLSEITAVPAIAGAERVSGAPGATSLLTLATRAAEPARSGAAPSSVASSSLVTLTSAPDAPAGDHLHRRRSKLNSDDEGSGALAATVAPVPTAVAAFVVGTGALAAVTATKALGNGQMLPKTDALPPAGTSAPAITTAASDGPTSPSAAVSLPVVDAEASIASPEAERTVVASPTIAAGEIGREPIPPAAANPVDAAIVPETVSVESHLGFMRNAPLPGVQPLRDVVIGAPASETDDPTHPGALRKVDLAEPTQATLDPETKGAGVDEAGSTLMRQPNLPDAAAPARVARVVVPSQATPMPEAAGTRAPQPPSALAAAPLNINEGFVPSRATPMPEATDAGSGAVGPRQPQLSSVLAAAPSEPAVEREVVSSRATPMPEVAGAAATDARRPRVSNTPALSAGNDRLDESLKPTLGSRAAADGAQSAGARQTHPAGGEALSFSSNDVAHTSPSSEPATDEAPAPAATTTAAGPATAAIAEIVRPNPQAAPPVAQQVADGIVGLASAVVPDEPAFASRVAPARTMVLQLSPAGLGTLSVRLHVAGRALDVHLEASDGRTAALIDRDRDALSGAMRGKDYQLQSLSVTTHDATMPGGNHAERGTDSGSTDRGSPGPFRDGPSGDRSGDGSSREAPGREGRSSRQPAENAAVERGGSALFV